MANEVGKTTKKDIQATELMVALVNALQRDGNYDKFVGGRDTGAVRFLENVDGTTRVVISLGAHSE